MAEVALSAFLQVIFEKLASPILEEFRLFKDLHEDIIKLRNTVSIIMGVLADAEEKQQRNRAVTEWLKVLKEAAYDADDILDQCKTEALRRKLETEGKVTNMVRDFFSAFNPVLFDLRMAHKIKEIRRTLDTIAEERSKFDLRVGGLPVFEARDKTDSFINESSVYGRDKDKENIVELLLNANNDMEVSVIPVVGIGGLGKTTLAKCVYNDARVGGHFDLRIWVCVSDDFDVGRLTKSIHENAATQKCDHEDVDVIQRCLRKHLSEKKFLLVLDDVWDDNQDRWERLKGFLQAGAIGSKIIVTTRSEKVASIMGTLPSQRLARISDDDCWSIFKQRAFRQGQEDNPNLVDIGKEITKKCGGVPLIAKALGGLMRFKTGESQWRSIQENEIRDVLREDYPTSLVLRLSYYHLTPQLKQCFAFCSVFPKDHHIQVEELIQLWIAEGFIQPSQGSKPMEEEIGRGYFDDLLWRSFFQDAEKDGDGNVVSCKMHDLMHDLAELVSEDARSIVSEDGKIIIPDECHHLSVEVRGFQQVSITSTPSNRAKKLRTLLLLRLGDVPLSPKIFTHLPCLRVLDTANVTLSKDMLNSISGLKQLRYLCLYVDCVKILSNSLSKLHNLQTLRLINCKDLNELPRDMRKMISLRHLQFRYYHGSLTHMPAKMGELTSLQTLPVFVVGEDSGRNIRQLGNLKYLSGELGIQKLENVRDAVNAQEAQLSEKANLTSLGLSWSRRIADAAEMLEGLQPHRNLRCLGVENYGGERLPHWMGCRDLPNLVKLSLSKWSGWEQVQLPGQFRSLKSLSVSGMDAVKCFGSDFFGDSAFPSLEELFLENMANLEEWSVCNGGRQVAVLPRLKSLEVFGCPKLSAVPCFPMLSELWLSGFEAESLPNCFFQNQLTHLSSLKIHHCQNLESLSWELGNVAATLEELHIYNCPKLVSLFPEEMQNYSPCLRNLKIWDCYGLTSLRLQGLDSLTHLQIWYCDGLTSLRLQGLDSLTSLSIYSCGNLASFVGGMHHLTALQRLSIDECPELLGSLVDGMEHLTSLTSLLIGGCYKVTHLPEGLKHATRLKYLDIVNLPNLSALPDWIGNLSSLQDLYIHECPNLVSLPFGFQHLTNLQYLQIRNCHPELEKRCEKERGEDWHKISHIPRIDIQSVGPFDQRHGRVTSTSQTSRWFNALIPSSCIRPSNLNGW